MELAEFLLARVNEDEAAAREALPDEDDPTGGAWGEYGEFTNRCGDAAVHVARWSPARVLRRCESDRKIVERCAAVLGTEGWEYDDAPELAEATLRLLALPYADHPDHPAAEPVGELNGMPVWVELD